jgi:tetratricopeptide (TPR) repeat protein
MRRAFATTFALVLPLAGSLARAEEPGEEEIRPLDRIVLKNGNSLDGIIESGGEGSPEIVIRLENKASHKLKAEDVREIIPRLTADEVYKKKARRASEEKDPATRARLELALGKWAKTPHPALDGKPPREQDALRHLLNSVELEKTLTEAYPHILSLLDAGEGGEGEGAADLEVKVALLAREGGYDDPEVDFRLGILLAGPLGLPRRAVPYLERVLTAKGGNRGNERKARAILADIHRSAGAPGKAVALYEAALVSPETDPANFEPLYELARLHARSGEPGASRTARELFAKAQALQPDYLDVALELAAIDYREGALAAAEKTLRDAVAKDQGRTGAAIDLALVRLRLGRFAPAEKALRELLPKAAGGAERARAHLGLGILRENKGDAKGAIDEYQAALAADPGSAEARVALAAGLVQLSRPDEARKLARDLLVEDRENRWLFAACSRVLAEAELAQGRDAEALAHFARAVEVDAKDAPLLERTGVLLLRAGKPDLGYDFLRRAREAGGDRPDTLNAMAAYHYGRGDMIESKKLFDQVLKLVPAPAKPRAGQPQPVVPAARAYALRGIEMIADAKRLQVFTADFAGADSESLNGWEELERSGPQIVRRGGMVVLAGKQSAADGVTSAMLQRPIDATSFDRIAMTARVDAGKARVGLRLEGVSARGGASAGLILYRDLDGLVRVQVKTTQGDWEVPPATEGEPIDGGKPGTAGARSWPEGPGFHSLEIRRSRRITARTAGGFDLYLDGELIFWNIRVAGLTGKTYSVGLSCQTDAVGNDVSVSVRDFKVYREVLVRRSSANL